MITRLHIENYKSLKNVALAPGPFNVFIGANAAGKSNLIDCLSFISDIYRNGLERAISEKGGYHNICFRREQRTKSGIRLHLTYSLNRRSERFFLIDNTFEIVSAGRGISADFIVKNEQLKVAKLDESSSWIPQFVLEREKESKKPKIKTGAVISEDDKTFWDFITSFANNIPIVPDELISNTLIDRIRAAIRFSGSGRQIITRLSGLEQMRTYHFIVPVCAQASAASPAPQLGFQGEHLASTIDFLQKKGANGRIIEKVLEKLQTAVPEIKDIKSVYTDEKKLGLTFIEKTGKDKDIQWKAHEVSDGTITALALFVALYDDRSTVIAIDEPENAIHPWIAQAFVEACREASEDKQIFLTTQSRDIADLSTHEVFTVEKRNGQTTISKVSEKHPEFDDERVAEIWLSGMIGAVPEQMELNLKEP